MCLCVDVWGTEREREKEGEGWKDDAHRWLLPLHSSSSHGPELSNTCGHDEKIRAARWFHTKGKG